MSSVTATPNFRPGARQLHDRVRSLERLCRRATGGQASPAAVTALGQTIISSGLPSLDRLLPHGGIRLGSLIDWLEPAAESGIETAAGAAAFALAVAVRLQAADSLPASRPIVVVDRGGRFYPPAVLPWLAPAEQTAWHGEAAANRRQRRTAGAVASRRNHRREHGGTRADRRLYVIRPDSEADEMWAIDQALRCPGVAAVVGWPQQVAATPQRRWQLAAKASGVVGLFVRPAVARHQPTWSEVRVQVQPAGPADLANDSAGRLWIKSAAAGRGDQQPGKPSVFSGLAQVDCCSPACAGKGHGGLFPRTVSPSSWINVRAYRLVRVGGGWEAATAVAEPATECLLDLTSGRECPCPAGTSSQPNLSRQSNWKELACRAS